MLGHRLRRWPNIDPALGECLVFDGLGRRIRQTGAITWRCKNHARVYRESVRVGWVGESPKYNQENQ